MADYKTLKHACQNWARVNGWSLDTTCRHYQKTGANGLKWRLKFQKLSIRMEYAYRDGSGRQNWAPYTSDYYSAISFVGSDLRIGRTNVSARLQVAS